MIQPIKQNKIYEDKVGDFLFGGEYFTGHVKEIKNVLPLTIVDCKTAWHIAKQYGVDLEQLKKDVMYDCPYIIGNKYYGFIPLFIETSDCSRYRHGNDKQDYRDYYFDIPYWSQFFSEDSSILNGEVSNLNNVMLGHGYTDCNLPMDGHGRIILVYIDLDNGDRLVGYTWVWFNK